MDKFGRTYELKVQVDDQGHFVTIRNPFTVEFDITRNTLTSANVCQLRLYNLSERTRNLIRFNISDYGTYRGIQFKAGYGDNRAGIFSGNISQAWSIREGVNFITQIECYDGGFAFNNGKANIPISSNTTRRNAIGQVIDTLPGIARGAIGGPNDTITRGNTINGSSLDALRELTPGNSFFVDNEKANVLGTNEYIEDGAPAVVVNSRSGLLGTPALEQTIVHFDMIFQPNLVVGARVILDSITGLNYNGAYKITAVKHRGMISDAVCGSVVTTGEFFYTKLLTGVKPNG